MTIGERLRALRIKRLWSMRKAAEFFGVSLSEIWRLESEKNQPNLLTNAKWERLLDEAERSIEDGNFYTIEDTRTDEEKEASYKKMKQQIDIAMRLYYEYLNNIESN